jgi:hypothetical protein
MLLGEIVAVYCLNKINHARTLRERDISHVCYSRTNNGILGKNGSLLSGNVVKVNRI